VRARLDVYLRALLLLCTACLLSACTMQPAEPGLTTVRPNVHAEPELAPLLNFDAPVVESEPGVLLRVEITVRTAEDVDVRYRFIFVDGSDAPLESDPAWRRQQISPAAPSSFEATVISPDAASWSLEVRSAR
jgi:hypothetical protein